MLSRMRGIWGSAGFTLMELLVVVTIIMILSSMLMPSLQQAREKAKYARWVGYSNNLRCDDGLIGYYDFEYDAGQPEKLKNKAMGPPMSTSYDAKRANGYIHRCSWVTGRWLGKKALRFVIDGVWQQPYVKLDDSSKNLYHPKVPEMRLFKDDVTLELWMKTSNSSDTLFLFQENCSSLTGRDCCIYLTTDGVLNFSHAYPGYSSSLDGVKATVSIRDGNWHHLAFVAKGLQAWIYVDGEEQSVVYTEAPPGAMTYPFGPYGSDYAFALACNANGQGQFEGYMGEFAIYNRALTGAEVKAHYKMGKP